MEENDMQLTFEAYKDKVRACWLGKNLSKMYLTLPLFVEGL